MTALIGLASGTAATAAVTGFFGFRTKRLDADSSDRAALWKRIADLEAALRDQQREHRNELQRMEHDHRAEVAGLETKIKQLQVENFDLATKLNASMIEVQALRARVQYGAGVSLPPSTTPGTASAASALDSAS